MLLVATPISVNHQAVKRENDSTAMVVVYYFVYNVSTEEQREERFWFHSRSYEPVLSRHWSSKASSTDMLEG